jgi:hypothetical protein
MMTGIGSALLFDNEGPQWALPLWSLVTEAAFITAGICILRMKPSPPPPATAPLRVVDPLDARLRQNFRPVPLLMSGLMVTLTFVFWSFAFKVLPHHGIGLLMVFNIALMSGAFVVRYVLYRFAEDLVLAATIAAAWGLYLASVPGFAWVGVLATFIAGAAVYSRFLRGRRLMRDWAQASAQAAGQECAS